MRKRNYRLVKKVVCLLMTGAIVLTGVPTGLITNNGVEHVYAEEYTVGESTYRYEVLEDGTIAITGYSGSDTEIIIPSEIDGKKVTSIGDWAFSWCMGLTTITIPEGVVSIGEYAFFECIRLETITVPEGVTSIGEGAFLECSSLTEIAIPKGVTSIGDRAFEDCSSLTEITIPKGVTSIGDRAFYGCSSLTEIIILEGITSIGDRAFEGCSSLTTINVSESNAEYKSIDGVLISKSGDLLVKYPEGKETTRYSVPEGVTSIGDYAFSGCSSLTEITIPKGVTSIESNAFSGCSSLETIVIPKEVTSIGDCAFSGCSSLETIVIPEEVTSIGDYTFLRCSNLTTITIPERVTSIGDRAFYGCSNLKEINVSEGNVEYKSIEGVLFSKSGDLLVKYPEGKETTRYSVPEGVTSIGEGVFSGCSSLTEIIIPKGVTNIGWRAFSGCSSLETIVIPEEVTSIGWFTFEECSSLREITIPEGVTSIGRWTFSGCSSLTEITIPKGVTSIGEGVFSGCSSLTEITIPEGVTDIVDWAFQNCKNLKEIKIPKTVEYIGGYAIGYSYDTYQYERYDDFVIYGYAGTAAETYATDNGFEFVAIKETSDEEKNIVVEYPENIVEGNVDLQVNELTETDESYKNLNLEEKIVGTGVLPEEIKFKVYDIKLLDEEANGVQPTGEVTVKIPCPEGYESGKCKVYHIDAEGNVTEMRAVFDGEYFVFTTNHFSVYIVTQNRLKTNSGTISGDVNDDRNIDTQDAVLLKKYLAGYKDLGIDEDACDVNNDGSIDSADAVILLKHLAGYEGMLQ